MDQTKGDKYNNFIKKCEDFANIHEIRNFSVSNKKRNKANLQFEKFVEGTERMSQLFRKICKSN